MAIVFYRMYSCGMGLHVDVPRVVWVYTFPQWRTQIMEDGFTMTSIVNPWRRKHTMIQRQKFTRFYKGGKTQRYEGHKSWTTGSRWPWLSTRVGENKQGYNDTFSQKTAVVENSGLQLCVLARNLSWMMFKKENSSVQVPWMRNSSFS